MARRKQVTLQFLAEYLNLSSHTVSKALRGLPGMSEETRRKVVETAEMFGYQTRDQLWSQIWEGRDLAAGKSRRFLFITGINVTKNSAMHRILESSLRERLEQMGNELETVEFPIKTISSKDEIENLLDQNGIEFADGIFLSFGLPRIWEECLLKLQQPKIVINFPPVGAEADSVVWDVYDGVQQALAHLISHQHQRILYIGDKATHRGYRLRWMAFQEITSQFGLDNDEQLHLTTNYTLDHDFFDDFEVKWFKFQPTALLCSIEKDLRRVLCACNKLSIEIPQHCSLVFLDPTENKAFDHIASPGVSVRETAFRAADRMIWRIANAHMPYEHIRLKGKFRAGTTVNSAVKQQIT